MTVNECKICLRTDTKRHGRAIAAVMDSEFGLSVNATFVQYIVLIMDGQRTIARMHVGEPPSIHGIHILANVFGNWGG